MRDTVGQVLVRDVLELWEDDEPGGRDRSKTTPEYVGHEGSEEVHLGVHTMHLGL